MTSGSHSIRPCDFARIVAAVALILAPLVINPAAGAQKALSANAQRTDVQRGLNTAPSYTAPRKSLKVVRGGVSASFVVGTVSDSETPAGDLVVTLASSPEGVTVTNVVNTNGTVTADIAATCTAPNGRRNIRFAVSDGGLSSERNIRVVVQTNTGPILGAYGTTTIPLNGSDTLAPSAPPSDNGSVTNVTVAVTSPAGFTGSVSVNPTTGVVEVTNAAPANTYTGTVTATDNCGTTSTTTFTLIVSASPNVPPVVDAGPSQTVDCCEIIQLDGTGSSDPDSGPSPLTYAWTQVGGAAVVLFNATTATPSFQALNVSGSGTVSFQLTVSDGELANSAFVTITVNEVTGRHVDTEGLFVNGGTAYFLHNCNFYGPADVVLNYGAPGLIPVSGDFDGDGVDTIGGYDASTGCFFLRDSNTPGPADNIVCYGGPNAVPLIGDWDGDGIDTVGIYVAATGTFLLRNSNTPGPADVTFVFGSGGPGLVPIVGDWDGNGTATAGLFVMSNGTFFLRNSNAGGVADITFRFGVGGSDVVPLAGNWDGLGGDSVGLYIKSTGVFFLRNVNDFGPADITYQYGVGGDLFTPLVGNWDGL